MAGARGARAAKHLHRRGRSTLIVQLCHCPNAVRIAIASRQRQTIDTTRIVTQLRGRHGARARGDLSTAGTVGHCIRERSGRKSHTRACAPTGRSEAAASVELQQSARRTQTARARIGARSGRARRMTRPCTSSSTPRRRAGQGGRTSCAAGRPGRAAPPRGPSRRHLALAPMSASRGPRTLAKVHCCCASGRRSMSG